MDYLRIPLGEHAPEIVTAVVEVPGGQTNKYEYDPGMQVFRLDRPLYASVHYPGDYGFIPSTRGGDGDPLDVMILLPQPTFPGCVLAARPIGVLQMLDQGEADEKVLAVASASPIHEAVHNHRDLASHVLREIEHFFSVYKELEGKHTQVSGWKDFNRAHDLVRQAHQRFLEVK